MVIPDPGVPLDELVPAVEATLRELTGGDVARLGPRCWSWRVGEAELFAALLEDAGPRRREPGAQPERALELIKPLHDLDYSGALDPELATQALVGMSASMHARLAAGSHPDGSRKQALLAITTLFLEDLDVAELKAAYDEVIGLSFTTNL